MRQVRVTGSQALLQRWDGLPTAVVLFACPRFADDEADEADKGVRMVNDDLRQLQEMVEEMRVHPSPFSASQAVNAARIAWASFYNAVLLIGVLSTDELVLFETSLDECLDMMSTMEERRHLDNHKQQIRWYRHLLDLVRRHGIDAATRAITSAIEAPKRTNVAEARGV